MTSSLEGGEGVGQKMTCDDILGLVCIVSQLNNVLKRMSVSKLGIGRRVSI